MARNGIAVKSAVIPLSRDKTDLTRPSTLGSFTHDGHCWREFAVYFAGAFLKPRMAVHGSNEFPFKAKFYSMRQAGDLRRATRAGRNPKVEATQFDDRGDHTQAQAQAFDVSTFV
jgi:hypothetical protein